MLQHNLFTPTEPASLDAMREMVRLANVQNYQGLQDYVLTSPERNEVVLGAVWDLLNEGHTRGAYLISKLLHLRGVMSPMVSFAMFFGGLEMGYPDDAEEGKRRLRYQFEQQTPDIQTTTYKVIEPLIMAQISKSFMQKDFTDHMLRIMDVIKQLSPDFRTRFDLDAPAVRLDLPALRATGHAKARLLEMPGPPAGSPRTTRKAIVAFRELVFPHFNNSRLLEQGPTMVQALNTYGWNARFLGMQFFKKELEDARAIYNACMAEQPDVLIVDAVIFQFAKPYEVMAELRAKMPNMKIVGLYFDAWSVTEKQLRGTALHLDLIWTVSPDWEFWQIPDLASKVMHLPLPRGGDYGGPILPLQPKMLFSGGVAAYNWHRALWIAACRKTDLPLETHMDGFVDDKLPPLESYLAYMRRLADARCSINFSMRQNMSTFSVTARTFETIAAGSLLVQERAPEADCFFIEGEHYLPFSSFAELKGIFAFLKDHTAEAEKIRRRGNDFYRQRYHDDKLVGTLDHRLFGA